MREVGFFRGLAVGISGALLAGIAGSYFLFADQGVSEQNQTSTQPYNSSRYALLNGPVLTLSLDAGPVVQNALFRIDTYTGQVWVLQLSIQTQNNPVITAATFLPTIIQTAPLPVPNANSMDNPIQTP